MSGGGETYYKRFLEQWRHKIGKHRQSDITRPGDSPSSSTASIMAARGQVAEIEGFDSSKVRNFPFSSFKLLGALQIGIGAICVLLGVIDLFLYLYVTDDHGDQTLSALTIASVPIWSGLWFVVCGFMGTCMSLNQKTTLAYFKLTFMALSVLCALLFAPALCVVEIFIVARRTEGANETYQWLIPLLIAFFAFNELICAIITAGISCCCAPLNHAKVRVLYTRNVDELRFPTEKRRPSSPEIFFTDHSSRRNTKDEQALVLQKSARLPPQNPPLRSVMTVDDHPEFEEEPEVVEPRREPRAVMSASSPTMTHYSRPPTYDGNNYKRLKQLMAPGNPEAW